MKVCSNCGTEREEEPQCNSCGSERIFYPQSLQTDYPKYMIKPAFQPDVCYFCRQKECTCHGLKKKEGA